MSMELRGQLYILSYAVGFFMMTLITLIRSKAYRTGIPRAAVYSVITFLSGFTGAVIIGMIYDLLALLKNMMATVFVDVLGAVVFSALFLLAAVNTEKAIIKKRNLRTAEGETEDRPKRRPLAPVSYRDTMDLVIPGAFVFFACIKIGCALRGCCWGFECSWGVTAPSYYNKTTFPVQLFESASIFIIAVASHFVQKASFYRRGMAGPFAAFLYGVARFFWEFFRWNPPEMRHFFLWLTIWQLFCILIWAVAGTWMRILFKTQPAEPRPKRRKRKKKSKKPIVHSKNGARKKKKRA